VGQEPFPNVSILFWPVCKHGDHVGSNIARVEFGPGMQAGRHGHHFQQKGVLIGPVLVDCRLANAGFAGDSVHTRRLDTQFGDELERRIQNLLVGAQAPRSRHGSDLNS